MHSAVVTRRSVAWGTSVVCGKLCRQLYEALGAMAVFLAWVESHEKLLDFDDAEGGLAFLLKAPQPKRKNTSFRRRHTMFNLQQKRTQTNQLNSKGHVADVPSFLYSLSPHSSPCRSSSTVRERLLFAVTVDQGEPSSSELSQHASLISWHGLDHSEPHTYLWLLSLLSTSFAKCLRPPNCKPLQYA